MKYFSSQSHRSASSKRRTATLRMARLEDRLTPSGFGPEDGAYIVESWIGSYNDVKIQPTDQKILAVGGITLNPTTTSDPNVALARYTSIGNPDVSYGSGGVSIPQIPGSAGSLVLQPDGKAVVSSSEYFLTIGQSRLGAARFQSDGSRDKTFSSDGVTSVNADPVNNTEQSYGVGLQSNGQIVVAGSCFSYSAIMGGFKTNGAVNSGKGGFGQIVNGKAIGSTVTNFGATWAQFESIEVQLADNKIVAVGRLNLGDLLVARYTANGVLDTTFNGSGYTVLNVPEFNRTSYLGNFSYADRVALQSDGKIVVLSNSQAIDGELDMLVTRFNANGTLDTIFGGGAGYVRLDIDGAASPTSETGASVILQSNGKIVAIGGVNEAPNTVILARLNANGTLDATFGIGGFKSGTVTAGHTVTARGVALQSNGDIIVAGSDNDGTNSHPLLMRFFGGSSLLAEGGAGHTASDAKPLTIPQVQPLLTEAISRWQSRGFNVSSLQGVDIRISDLGGTTLGMAAGNTIWLDDNAAGWGWFVDKTPGDDTEFQRRGNQGEQGRMDLLSALMHEAGHIMGFDHEENGAMQDTLATGERHLPIPTPRSGNIFLAPQSSYMAMLAAANPDDDSAWFANWPTSQPSTLLAVGMP